MNIYLFIILLGMIYILSYDHEVHALGRGGGGRGGGGSRGGGSRSGGSRSSRSGGGYRSSSRGGTRVKSRTIYTSSRYNSWSVRVGVSTSVRYRSSPWSTQHHAIYSGYIIMSHHERARYHSYDQSYYNGISVCFNEEPLYGRNVTASPWFVCPWDDTSERYCCGEEVEERCCRYFDRTGPKAGLIVGCILIIILFSVVYCCVKKSRKIKEGKTIVYAANYKVDNPGADGSLLIYPPAPINPTGYTPGYNDTTYPVYPADMGTNAPCPAYPAPMDNNPPYPSYPATMDNNLPYPANPANNNPPYPVNSTNVSMAPNYPGAAPTAPNNDNSQGQLPPAYEDALRIKS